MARRGYVQLANGFYLNRKVRRLRRTMPSAIGAYAIILSYCGDNLTDGYVDSDTAEFVLDITVQELDALQQSGLIESVDGGYVGHDYLEHNRSREQVLRERKRTANRVNRLRKTPDVTPLHPDCNGVTSQKHQNTRTPEHQKKEKEEYSSSFSKETGVKDFGDSQECGETDRMLATVYPNLDLESAWLAFATSHQDETRAIGDWTRLWKGWCQRRANMAHIPKTTPHTHTWTCEHTLKRLGIESRDDVQDLTEAQRTADELNKEDRNGRT